MDAQQWLDGQTLLVDKPLNWSSFQAVNKIKYFLKHQSPLLKKIKVGHAGTLDPLATGLLIVCVGKHTKQIANYQGLPKEYTGTFTLGATTPSYDLETPIDSNFATSHITQEMIHQTALTFLGDIMQKPPIFSAIKKDGKRLYEHARKNEVVDIVARPINISTFEITKIEHLTVHFRIVCSKGTYIRSIAHDFGLSLKSGAHLSSLRRTKIGAFDVDNAFDVNQIETHFSV